MEPLATVADMQVRLGTEFDAAQSAMMYAILSDVSNTLRLRLGMNAFDAGPHTTTFSVVPRAGSLDPITISRLATVTSVTASNGSQLSFEKVGETISFSGLTLPWNIEPLTSGQEVTIVYTTNPIPLSLIQGLVCQIAGRAFGTKSTDSGLSQEAIEGYSYQVGSAAASGPIGLLPSEEKTISLLRGMVHKPRSIWVS